ncbi:MAG: hypothetical protein ACRD1H_08635 [Vicinamibacterales bacterium]
MLEIWESHAAVVACLARPQILDRFFPAGAFPCRAAPDELLLLGPRWKANDLERAAAAVTESDGSALVVDQTSGWTCWTLAGAGADEAFTRLSAVPLPPERPVFLQGAVADIQAKVIAREDCIDILVLSTAAHHMRKRMLAACRDLDPSALAPRELELAAAAASSEGVPA